MKVKYTLWNLVMFNVAWFGLVFIGNLFIPIAAILLGAQLWFFQTTKNEIILICLVATIGIWLDFALISTGVFIFPDTDGIPFWLITLWIVFAGTIRHSLAFLANSKIMQFFIGAIFAPLSYLAGAKLSVLYLVPSWGLSYLLLAGLWGPLMLVFFGLSHWLQVEDKCHVSSL
ncbi:DUF2878 domain-containing protein [Cognaticolwellia beringensis]|uniref:DUF2878 domain-containing protein n=1 Tax=Cognaticolwellia beringensis TaxID=1967665 RepID=A0A222G854_9GAMM|nr:DUF2878 domain-containing protein [Cognaticolwellia beringensis]ASP48067.1 DUF2878 domain-containing protein [Cognaticolwellia beringensis]